MPANNVVQFTIEVVDKVTKELEQIRGKLSTFISGVARVATRLVGAFGLAAGAWLGFVNTVAGRLDELDKLSKQTGLSAEALSQLQTVATVAGVSMDSVANSMVSASRRISEAAQYTGGATDALKELNLNAQELNNLKPDQQFRVLAESLAKVENRSDRLRLAYDLFGRSAKDVVALLDDGIEGFDETIKKADQLHTVISTRAAKAASDFKAALGLLKQQLFALASELVANTLPKLTDLINKISGGIPKAVAIFKKWLLVAQQAMRGWVADLARSTAKFLEWVAILRGSYLGAGLKAQANGLKKFAEGLDDSAASMNDAIVAADEYIGSLENIAEATTKTGLSSPAPVVGQYLEELEEIVIKVKRRIGRVSKTAFDPLLEAAKQAARNIQDAFAEFFFNPFEDGLKGLVRGFIDAIRRMIAQVAALQTVKFFKINDFLENIVGRATGGPVQAGRSVVVGEHGPELFVPNASGNIISNQDLKRGGASGSPQFITNIDARGADPSLIARLPRYMDQRDRQLMLKVKRYFETGVGI